MAKISARFKLAYSSPLLQEPLVSKFGISEELPAAKLLLSLSASILENDLDLILSLFQKINDISI